MSAFHTPSRRVVGITALLTVGALGLSACSGAAGDPASPAKTVNLYGYSVLEQANKGVISAFEDTDAGKDVDFKESYGASGDQSRAVEAGARADEVHFSLEPDVTRLVDAGIVAPGWKDTPTQGVCTSSIVVMVVRKGNPLHIDSWDDLVKPGVGIVTPNPASSGSAKWNILAAYGSVLANAAALPHRGRHATTAFTSGTGDVLLSYENEAILAKQSGTDIDYVVPDSSLKIENSCAVTKDASQAAQDFLDFQTSEQGQKLYAETGYRPLVDVRDLNVEGANDPTNPYPDPATLQTIDGDFGGWDEANAKFFDENDGLFTKLQAEAGQ
jgi:sulfate transport system substrate-binding protein